MNKQTFLSTVFSVALLLLTACSNDDNKTTDEGQVNAAQAIEFKVNFADYNAEQEVNVTRAGNQEVKLEQQTVDLGNGILAQCTLHRDTTKRTKLAATRALANDTYTMLAYDATTHAYKGDITGTVTSGVFTPTSANQDLVLTPGTYDFVLYNSKVTRSGNNLTVYHYNVADALIGRTQQVITATPHKQEVPFTMKHVGAKVTILLLAYTEIPSATGSISSVNATDVPGSSIYDASTGTWTAGTGLAVSNSITCNTGSTISPLGTFYTKSNEETVFMPTTDVSKLRLNLFSSGSIYKQPLSLVNFIFKPTSPLKLEQNGAYVLVVKLMYNFLYLMSDGSIGDIRETTYGGAPVATAKTPIAVVLSQSKRMAIALNDAGSGAMAWCTNSYLTAQTNTHMTVLDPDKALAHYAYECTSGKDETWDPSYTHSSVTGNKVKGENPDFIAFKAAADYNPGVAYTGSPALKWYLPSYSDWTWAFSALGLGDRTTVTQANHDYYGFYGFLANVAFTQVGGMKFSGRYWSSSEHNAGAALSVFPNTNGSMNFGGSSKMYSLYTRAFVAY